jgi:dUTP pyrophosphatase
MKIRLLPYYTRKGAQMPVRAHYNDAGADVFMPEEDLLIPAHGVVKIPLGFGLELPDGFMAAIFPRSSLAAAGIVCQIPPIDAGYRGEICAIVANLTDCDHRLLRGAKIGQIVILPVVYADFTLDLPNKRGSDGFGSTGA